MLLQAFSVIFPSFVFVSCYLFSFSVIFPSFIFVSCKGFRHTFCPSPASSVLWQYKVRIVAERLTPEPAQPLSHNPDTDSNGDNRHEIQSIGLCCAVILVHDTSVNPFRTADIIQGKILVHEVLIFSKIR